MTTPVTSVPGELRARSYRLLARLVAEGLDEETLPFVADVPGLGDRLPEPLDPDESAAEHHRVFGLEAPPYASVFLESSGRPGGETSRRTALLWRRIGEAPPGRSEAPDHLAGELRLAARLTEASRDDLLAELLGGQTLWWLPPYARAVGRLAAPFWGRVVLLAHEAVADHAATLDVAPPDPPGALGRPPPETFAGDPSAPAGPRDVAAFLVRPVQSGLFLSRSDLRALGRAADAPGGFGDRRTVATNLLRSAVHYDALPAVVGKLRTILAAEAGASASLDRVPAGFSEPWSARLAHTDALLGRLLRDHDAGGAEPVG